MVKPDKEKIKKALDLRHEKLAAPEKFNWKIEPNMVARLNDALIKELNKTSTEPLTLESSANYLEAIDKANKLTSDLKADSLYNQFAKILIIKTGHNNETYQHLVDRYRPIENTEEHYAQLYDQIVSELTPLHKTLRSSELHQFVKNIVNDVALSDRMLAKQKLILKIATSIKSDQVSRYSMVYSNEFIFNLIQSLHDLTDIKKHEKRLKLYQEIYAFNLSPEVNKLVENLVIKLDDQVKEYTEMMNIKEWIKQDPDNIDAVQGMLEIRNLLSANPYGYDLLRDLLEKLKLIKSIPHSYRETIKARILISQFLRGDFFSKEEHNRVDQLLPFISMAISSRDLINLLSNHINDYTQEQIEEMVLFIKKYLDFDKTGKNVPYFYKESLFVEPLIFCANLLKSNIVRAMKLHNVLRKLPILLRKKLLQRSVF